MKTVFIGFIASVIIAGLVTGRKIRLRNRPNEKKIKHLPRNILS